eukprot:TRINITY_DN3503_c0_g1_i1.p1 TRINITY_DN3503_c0_g1~~TRINITY_DN3503_c0_g1_i1.p1  ORF type:complete len:176 (+),score=34.90 TRINITY_DN3503_c0_g1_i1:29-556(+)
MSETEEWESPYMPDSEDSRSVAPFVATSDKAISFILRIANITAEDCIFDLGCGDGRLLIEAAKEKRARGVGIELKEELIVAAKEKAREEGVQELLTFSSGDLFEADLSCATVVFFALLPWSFHSVRLLLEPLLNKGVRIISYPYPLEKWAKFESKESFGNVYLYVKNAQTASERN